ncbi:MAG: phospholipase D-like domain-containing protein [Planctomycetia bacterium]
MTTPAPADWRAALESTLDDAAMSRGERQALAELVGDLPPPDRAAGRSRAFELARERLADPRATAVLEWLEAAMKVFAEPTAAVERADSHFSPGDECLNAILGLLRTVRRSAELCVFTITDDRITDAIVQAHQRGAAVRLVTDGDKARDLGSDVLRLRDAGVGVRVDYSSAHMHHKFAIFDDGLLLTGSYNWTRSAAAENQENFIVSSDRRLVAPFQTEFERLWGQFAPSLTPE